MRYAIAIICCFTHALFAQPGFHTTNIYTTQNGLSDNSIFCIRQDSRGFLWIGTKEGLNRFDGFRFKRYFAAKTPVAGLANSSITDILEYRKGQLLIATASGLSVLNTLSSNFENKKITKAELKGGSGTLIRSLYKDKTGNIWINHSGELDLLDSNLHYLYRFTDLSWAKDLKGIIIGHDNWFTDRQNRLWLSADTSSISVIDFHQKKIWNNRNNPEQYEFLHLKYIRSAYLDESANVLWYAPWGNGIYRYDFNSRTQQKQNFGTTKIDELQSVNRIMKISPGKLLCIKGAGCYIIDVATLQYEQLADEAIGLQGQYINAVPMVLFKSANSNYWLGTLNGLFQVENEEAVSQKFSLPGAAKGRDPGEPTDIHISNSGKLYISCLNNILIESNKDLSVSHSYSIAGKKEIYLNCIREDKLKNIWVGSSKGLYQFNPSTGKFSQPAWLHKDLYNNRVNYIYCDREENVWFTIWQPFGIYRYTPSTNRCERINNSVTAHYEKLGVNSRISYMTEDMNQHIWMVSKLGGGIICYNKTNGEWSIYPKKNEHKSLLSKLGYVYADNKNNLWLNNIFGIGLIKYNYLTDSISIITRHDGLLSDFIKSIAYDGKDNLWILTEYGISQFNLQSQKIVFNTFFKTMSSGTPEFLDFDPSSENIIGAAKQQLIFYPVDKIRSAIKEPLHPIIDKIWVNSKEVNADVNGQSFKLKPGETNISIDFTVVHYSNADKLRFAYQLSGADHDWKYTENRSAQYAVLTPGKYTFRIKVADENGNWTDPFDTFSFTIVPPFWKTNFFKIALVLAIAGIAFYFFRRRIKYIRHEAEMKKQMADTEMMALRAQMNPHFIFNCLNSIDNLIQDNEKEKATGYLARFAKLIRAILENSKHQLIPVWKDIETLKLYLELETLRFDNKFSYRFEIADELQQGDYKIPPLLIQPFVENAIHHGLMNKTDSNRELLIKAATENGEIKFTIEDNGIGRQQAEKIKRLNNAQHQSLGQHITESRIKLFNNGNEIKIIDLVHNGEAAGTRVEITLENK